MNPTAHLKSPARPAIVSEVMLALSLSDRPLTLGDLYEHCETVETKQDLARVLTYLKAEGKIENGDEVSPGQPGGMTEGKGARAVASYRLPLAPQPPLVNKYDDRDEYLVGYPCANLPYDPPTDPLEAWADQADEESAGTNIGDAGIQSYIDAADREIVSEVRAALRTNYPDVAETFDRLDDDEERAATIRALEAEHAGVIAEMRADGFDAAESSRNGDEFTGVVSPAEIAPPTYSPDEVAFNRAKACSGWADHERDSREFDADVLSMREIADQSLIDLADALIHHSAAYGFPAPIRVWSAAKRAHGAVVSFSESYA